MATRIQAVRGDDVDLEITFTDSDDNAIDLTDGKVYFTVKENIDDADSAAIIQKEITSFDDPTSGIMTVALTDDDMDINPGDYYYDVQFKNSNGRISSSDRAKFVVTQDITLTIA